MMQFSGLGKEESRHKMYIVAVRCLPEESAFIKVMKECSSMVHVMTDEGQESRAQTVPAPAPWRTGAQAGQVRRGSWPKRQG